ASCNTNDKNTESTENETTSISVDEFIKNADSYQNSLITVSGLVTHVCKHGGQKLFIAGVEEGVSLRIETGENIPEFEIGLEGTEAEFTGKIILMDDKFIASSKDKHEQVNDEEEDCEFEKTSDPVEKVYYLVASSLKNL
ncbi:MAG: hypothetical protein KAS71_14340, partial [Bacteroidales bacterium]|nr:hypothetical protein [Bacteroidales bacterium]